VTAPPEIRACITIMIGYISMAISMERTDTLPRDSSSVERCDLVPFYYRRVSTTYTFAPM
jgi:hypothetical protein